MDVQLLKIELLKDNYLLPSVFLALALDPAPYTVSDLGDRLLLSFAPDIDPMRVYRLGILTVEMEKIVKGVKRDFVQKYPLWGLARRWGAGRPSGGV